MKPLSFTSIKIFLLAYSTAIILPAVLLTSQISLLSPIRAFKIEYTKQKSYKVLVNSLTTSYSRSSENTVILKTTYDYEDLIRLQCEKLNCDATQIIRIMYCESRGLPDATNGIYKGLFQHHDRYWIDRAKKYGLAGYDVYDPFAQIIVTTNMFADGLWYHWHCK